MALKVNKMLYVGYPVSYQTTCNLFSVSEELREEELKAVVSKVGLGFFWIDKNLCILGLAIREVNNLGHSFVSVDDSLVLILEKKKEVTRCLKEAGIDLSDFMIEKMEGEPQRVFNPMPYLISA